LVIRRGIALPMDEVLEGFGVAEEAGVKNGIDFVVFLTTHKVREGTGKVQAVSGCFMIGRQKGSMEGMEDAPLHREI